MLLLGVAGEIVGIPIAKVERVAVLEAASIEAAGRERFAIVDGAPLLVIDLAERLGFGPRREAGLAPLVLAEVREERVGLLADRLHGQQEIYVKPLPRLLARARGLAGLTVLPDGAPVFLLDLNPLA
jgi:chemotaxis protein histidine kinase CheA